jgi:hypothetical protein
LKFRKKRNENDQRIILTWKADNADEPVGMFVDGHYHKVFVKKIHFFGPLPHPIVALLGWCETGVVFHRVMLVGLVLARGPGGEPLIEVGGENVRLLKDGFLVLILPVLQVPCTQNRMKTSL